MVSCLLIGLEVPEHLEIWHLALFDYVEFNVAVHFSCFWVEMPFLGKFHSKNQIYQFKQKFGTYTTSNMQNSMVIFTFSVSECKYPSWANLVLKIKIISLSSNLVPALIQTCRIQWWYSLFLFLIRNTLFGQIWSKKSKLSVEAEIWYLD